MNEKKWVKVSEHNTFKNYAQAEEDSIRMAKLLKTDTRITVYNNGSPEYDIWAWMEIKE